MARRRIITSKDIMAEPSHRLDAEHWTSEEAIRRHDLIGEQGPDFDPRPLPELQPEGVSRAVLAAVEKLDKLPRPLRLTYKDEGEHDDGIPFGPVYAIDADGGRLYLGWLLKPEAREIALRAKCELEED